MTRREKLVDRIRARPPEADFDDVHTLMKAYGWSIRPGSSSHTVFVKPGERSITVPKVGGRRVKRVYLEQICERLGLDVGQDES